MINTIINNRLSTTITIHDALHGFRQRRGTGTSILKVKLVQQLAGILQKPLFQVFLDVKKSYDSLDQTQCMKILRGNGLGKNLQRFLEWLWEGHMVVSRDGGCYGSLFKTGR